MNIARVLAELKAERRRLDRAIRALEKLAFDAKRKKRPAPSLPVQRSATNKSTLLPRERVKVIPFRKPRKSVRSKPPQAEEA